MPIELIEPEKESATKYILVADDDCTVISSHVSLSRDDALSEAIALAKKIRAANGEVTIFKRTEY